MINSFFEIIIEAIVLLLFVIPGAFIRWMFSGFKKPFRFYLKKDPYINGSIGIVVIGLIIAIIVSYFR